MCNMRSLPSGACSDNGMDLLLLRFSCFKIGMSLLLGHVISTCYPIILFSHVASKSLSVLKFFASLLLICFTKLEVGS